MKKKLFLFIAFAVLGIVQAIIFMLMNAQAFESYSFAQCLLALIYAVPQALMVSAWVMIPCFVVGLIYVFIRGEWHRRFMIRYVAIVLALLFFLCMLDWVLYGFWGFRLDFTPFIYVLDNPLHAMAESPWWAFPLSIVLMLLLGWLASGIMKLVYPKRRSGSINRMSSGSAQQMDALWNLVMVAVMWIVGMGCFGLLGMGSAYFTDKMPLNHAATSPIYSFFHSLRQQRIPLGEQYRFMSDAERQNAMNELETLALEDGRAYNDSLRADSLFNDSIRRPYFDIYHPWLAAQAPDKWVRPIYGTTDEDAGPLLRQGVQPNVLILLFESFSGTACHYLNEEADERVMPNVCRQMEEGVAFTRFYANSFRTERALVSVLSAFPGQPTYTLMNDPARASHLPYLTRQMADAGYSMQFLFGSYTDFTHFPEYLQSAGIDQVVDREAFPSEQYDAHTGLHDARMFGYLRDELRKEAQAEADTLAEYPARPYCKIMLTVSSHEPFEVPSALVSDPYLNSVAYSDSCLGAFIDQLKEDTLIWNNLLIIGMPDHCYAQYPEGIQQCDPERYHIPMFWTGGAVNGHHDVNTVCQQTDLAATLLHQLGLSAEGFPYSHDIFSAEEPHFAFYAWPDGFGFLTDSCSYVQDNNYDGHGLPGTNDPTGRAQRLGKAYLQSVYDDMAGMK